jgi:hypothetical protein
LLPENEGPTADVIRQIDAELNRASQIDAILTNESSVEHFHRQVDALLQALELGAEHDASNASIMQRFQQLATGKSALIGDVVGAKPRIETNDKRRARGASWSIRSRSTGRLN